MRSRSATLTCPTHRYCSTASAGSSTRKSTATSVGPEGHLIFTGRSVTCVNRRKTLIVKVLHSLQSLCSPLTTPFRAAGNNAPHVLAAGSVRDGSRGSDGGVCGLCPSGRGRQRQG